MTTSGKHRTMKLISTSLLLAAGALLAQPALAAGPQGVSVTPLMARDLSDLPGKEGLMITVDYAPGAADPVHRHRAHGFIYVLEGAIVMQVKGGKEVTLTPGQTFYEGPNDIHTVGRNASTTQPAKFLVLLIKKKKGEVLELVK
jgi:quercetin dioxygenase-like cupin family protein